MTSWRVRYKPKGLWNLINFHLTSSHKNVQQRKINGNYIAQPQHMARFANKEHKEHRQAEKICSLRSPTFGVKNVPLKKSEDRISTMLEPVNQSTTNK